MIEKRTLTPFKIGIYIIIFFAVWSVRELYIRPVFLNSLDGITFGLVESSIKLLVWTLPAILLIRHFHNDMWAHLKAMFTNKIKWSRDYYFLIAIIAIPIVRALSAWLASGEIGIHPDFVPARLLEAVVFAGITEEVVFRGFLLNAFLKKMKVQHAIALDAVLFTLIHYPIWIYRGFDFSDFLTASVAVAVLSVGFAYSFIQTKNIFIPMALHMMWNLSIHLFFGSQ